MTSRAVFRGRPRETGHSTHWESRVLELLFIATGVGALYLATGTAAGTRSDGIVLGGLIILLGVIVLTVRLDGWQTLLVLTLAGTVVASGAGKYVLGRSTYLGVLGIAVLAFWTTVVYPPQQRTVSAATTKITRILLILAGFALLSAAWSPVPRSTALHGIGFIGLAIFLGATASRRWSSVAQVEQDVLLIFWVASCVLVASELLFFLHRQIPIAPSVFNGVTVSVPSDRLRGIFPNPNTLGIIAAITVPLGVGLSFDQSGSRRRRMPYALATGAAAAGLLLSGSRTAIIATIVAVIIMCLRRGLVGMVKGFFGGLLTAVGLLLVLPLFPNVPGITRLAGTLSGGTIDSITSGRSVAWSQAFSLWKAHPITGIGFSAGQPVFANLESMGQLSFGADSAHEGYLQVLMEMGVIGLSLVLVVVYLLLKQPTRKESWWLGCYGAVVAGCLVQFGESSILGIDSMFSPMFWILALASVSVFPPNPGTDSQGRKADAAAPVRLSRGHPGLAAPGRPTGSIRSSPRPHRRRIVVEAGVLRRPETPLSDTAALWGVSDVSTSSAAMLGGAATRAMAFVIDEGLSSLQNFAIMFAALRYLSISTLGFFTLAYNAGLLTETLLRSLLLAPLTIRYSHVSSSDQRRAGSRAAGASIAAGLLCAAIAVVVSWALRGDYREMLLALGFATLMLIVQEAWRVYFFTQRRPWLAVLNDGFCLLSTLALLVLVVAERGHPSAATLLVIWGAGTGCGAILGMGQAHLLPAVSQSWSWLREHWSLGSRLAGAQSAERLASQIAFILTAAIAGGVALGQISASRTLISPFTTLVVAVGTFAAPEAARLYHRRSGAFRLFTLAISVALTGAVAVFGVAIYALPDSIGRHMAGANWLSAKALLLPILVWTGSNAFRSGALTGLQVMERARQVLRFSLLTGLATLVAVPIGVTLSGAGGAAWAFATVSAITALCYWVVFARVSRDIRPDSDIHTSAVDQSASSVR